jgi:hypothetical protein
VDTSALETSGRRGDTAGVVKRGEERDVREKIGEFEREERLDRFEINTRPRAMVFSK